VTHANAPLNVEGRRRLVERCRSRPIAHVAAEAGVSRACLSKWKSRCDTYGEAGLQDHSSAPHFSPSQTTPEIVERIERLRRDNKWSARRIALELAKLGVRISERTVGRWPARLGVVTDNGANYRAGVFGRSVALVASRHQRTKPYTPRYNGKVER
jgi:transposase